MWNLLVTMIFLKLFCGFEMCFLDRFMCFDKALLVKMKIGFVF
jgi:hypothetical protein